VGELGWQVVAKAEPAATLLQQLGARDRCAMTLHRASAPLLQLEDMHRLQLQAAQQPLGLADAVVLDQNPPAAAVEQQLHWPDRFRLAALSLAALPVAAPAVAEQQEQDC
jgi:hypothetical protein